MAPLLPVLLAAWLCAPLASQADLVAVPLAEAGDNPRVSVALGDIDGDGIEDLVIGRHEVDGPDGWPGPAGTFAVRRGLAGAPKRSFAEARPLPHAVSLSCENTGQPRLVDFDRDGDLDLIALDTPINEQVMWFANDGHGEFAAPKLLQVEGSGDFAWDGQAHAVEVVDWDGDGHLDLVVATGKLFVHRGGRNGFAAASQPLGVDATAVVVADWDGDSRADVLTIEGRDLVVRRRVGDGVGESQRLARLEGDTAQTRLAVADWNGDGRLDVMLGEDVRRAPEPVDPARAADDAERLRVADRLLEVIRAEYEKLNASKPPIGDAAAMERRQQRRAELDRWAAGPLAVRDEVQRSSHPGRWRGAVRVLLRR